MFLAQQVTIAEVNDYDFEKVENAAKWKGLFINSLRKVRWFIHLVIGCALRILQYVMRRNIWKSFVVICLWYRFLSRSIHRCPLEKMHYTMWRAYAFDCCRCCAQNPHRTQYRWDEITFFNFNEKQPFLPHVSQCEMLINIAIRWNTQICFW